MSPSTGIIYNNEMADFSIPGRENNYGVPPSPANFVRPGMRPISSLTPSIILDNNKDVRMVIAGAGGPKMISGTAYVSCLN